MTQYIEKKSDQPVCDFCVDYSQPPKWWYAAKDDVMEVNEAVSGTRNIVLQSHPDGRSTVLLDTPGKVTLESTGGKWAACDVCRDLIDRKKMHVLAYISANQYIKNHKLQILHAKDLEILKERIFNVQQAFWRNYDGSPAKRMEEII